ncbi:TauD-domain-containing protein [Mollisia scopiformis]|uniref:TauD-domain-containing protein n=1 Tax=Mollisia scopiformis TaxID=149040 RepID=A0A194X726_MOLSC|nr:TauD-domain-containing protein [Mollisia scopiformis]KUJ15976.1 TauD-domain-containing protein [Mollisia scopiformis]
MPSTVSPPDTPTKNGPLFPDYLPHYDPLEKVEMVGSFEFSDPGLRADPSKQTLLSQATSINDLGPYCGTELLGVDLTNLSPAALDELALLTAQRGCVVFRNQDAFLAAGFDAQKAIASHFGPLHVHGWMPHPQNGPPEFVIVYDSDQDLRIRKSWARKNPIQFHVDQSPEAQPPGMTLFAMLESPPGVGGDTIICSTVRAFQKLSPKFRARLEGLMAVHTTQAALSREIRDNGDKSVVRRPVTRSVHPVVIVHPVTGQKALFVNSSYTQSIVGFDDDESDYLLKFLFDHINRGHDFSCRVRYEPGTVVLWDQRVTQHSQTLDYPAGARRHAFRLTPLANVPIPSKVDEDDDGCKLEEDREMLGLC